MAYAQTQPRYVRAIAIAWSFHNCLERHRAQAFRFVRRPHETSGAVACVGVGSDREGELGDTVLPPQQLPMVIVDVWVGTHV
jgi:hypothetical protein